MVNRHTVHKVRKVHRYLGLFIGIQFLFWTVSGLYFSWTDLDKIHGDHFKKENPEPTAFIGLMAPSELELDEGIRSLEIRDINGVPHYWINEAYLFNAENGSAKNGINKEEALYIANLNMKNNLEVAQISLIKETGRHHEYREKLLPAYVISYQGKDNLRAYVSIVDGQFQTVRHRSWRVFDFLWMTHTMDYQGRDNFNTTLLRVFSLFGLLTVLSGFGLWFTTSSGLRKALRKFY